MPGAGLMRVFVSERACVRAFAHAPTERAPAVCLQGGCARSNRCDAASAPQGASPAPPPPPGPRVMTDATLLPDGKVLIVNGATVVGQAGGWLGGHAGGCASPAGDEGPGSLARCPSAKRLARSQRACPLAWVACPPTSTSSATPLARPQSGSSNGGGPGGGGQARDMEGHAWVYDPKARIGTSSPGGHA